MKLLYAFVLSFLLLLPGSLLAQAVWSPSQPISPTFANTTSLAVSPVTHQVFVGSTDSGIMKTENIGRTWQQVLPHAVYSMHAKPDGTLYAGGTGVVYRSTDHGLTWTTHSLSSQWPVRKIIHNSEDRLYAATGEALGDENNQEYYVGDGIFTSTDNGQTWTQDNEGLLGTLSIWSIAIDKNDKVYIGTHDGNDRNDIAIGLFSRQKQQTAWQPVPVSFRNIQNLNMASLFSVALDADDSLYIGFQGSNKLPGQTNGTAVGGTLKSADGGQTWRPLYLTGNTHWNYWDQPVAHSLYVSQQGILFASNAPSRGILVSYDKGQTWARDMTNIARAPYFSMLQHFQFAETAYHHVYVLQPFDNFMYSKMYLLGSEPTQPGNQLSLELFPNPFGATLNVRFTLPAAAEATLTVHDAKGAVVYSQPLQGKAGVNHWQWTPGQHAHGLYSVKIDTQAYRVTKKVVLAR
ncbi:T9SS type A sorting domain-containing protein [Rufibacter psychrotolerans]|uniref:T9SS type A sorting domain-containing protein n=1 Tax=Rufibacter psychrotolerans TaxID=2812556 RepID=UPI0019674B86|nr:T9SS type A sorting domain-containing protein [Rufibacter sp. SYSU D00308]